MNLGDLAAVYPVLVELMGVEFDFDLAYEIDTFLENAKGRYDFYQRKRDELLTKYGEPDPKNPGMFFVSKDKQEAFLEDLEKLNNTATKFSGPGIPDTALRGRPIKPAVINALRRSGMLERTLEAPAEQEESQ